MSRSYRKTPVFKVFAERGAAHEKRLARRARRRHEHVTGEPAHEKAFGDPWLARYDGKLRWASATRKDLSK
jgi:hypothetical protein